jgi:hypothetical protein
MATFAHPAAPPAGVSFRTIEPSYGVYGWRVAVHRPALEFSELRAASRRSFTLRGSGTASVVTPRVFTARQRLRVRVRDHRGSHTRALVADGAGRLHVAITLGPGNAGQQDTPGVTTRVFSATVAVSTAR